MNGKKTHMGNCTLPPVSNSTIQRVLNECSEVLWAMKNLAQPHQWHALTMENFATNTREELTSMCHFAEIDCPETMMAAVDEMTHHVAHNFDVCSVVRVAEESCECIHTETLGSVL